MWKYNYTYSSSLCHHGILGQKWGKRNGPPYPLGSSKHSAAERKAGWRKSLSNNKNESKTLTSNGKKEYNKNKDEKKEFHLTDKQKKAIKIGAAVAVTALAAYGTYRLAKSGKLNEIALIGKNKVNSMLAGNAEDVVNSANGNVKRLAHNEPLSDVLKNTNPLRGTRAGENNCSVCGITAFLRMHGYDVTAKGTGGEKQNLGGLVETCFKNVKVLDGSATKFGRSRNDAAEMLLKRYGQNAEGVCNIQWKGRPDGHVFNWKIKDGVVSFFDAQNGWDDATVSNSFWGKIDPQGFLQLARLDNAEINLDAIKAFVN